MTMPEERFHAQFGEDFCSDLMEDGAGDAIQKAVDRVFPMMTPFFGAADSRNNAMFRKWGIKLRTNEEMREDYIGRARTLVEEKFGLSLPDPVGAAA